MPAIFILFLYNYSSGMALYMVVSTLASDFADEADEEFAGPGGAGRHRLTNPALTPASKSKK